MSNDLSPKIALMPVIRPTSDDIALNVGNRFRNPRKGPISSDDKSMIVNLLNPGLDFLVNAC